VREERGGKFPKTEAMNRVNSEDFKRGGKRRVVSKKGERATVLGPGICQVRRRKILEN